MKTLLRSSELSCPSCVVKIEKALSALDGVQTAVVHFNTGRIEVEHDPVRASAGKLIETVLQMGYESAVATL